jgi:hypothetical protein
MVGNGENNNASLVWAINNRKWESFGEDPFGILCGRRASFQKCHSSGSCFFNL